MCDGVKDSHEPLSLCGRRQEHLTPKIAKLLFRVADASETGGGTVHLVELIRRLVELRGIRQVSSTLSVIALGRLATFLDLLHQVLDEDSRLEEKESIVLFDSIVQQFLKTSHFFYVDPGSSLVSSASRIVNGLLEKLDHRRCVSLPEKVYPVLFISIHECLRAATAIKTPQHLQFVISRFFKRTFCRLPNVFLSGTTTQRFRSTQEEGDAANNSALSFHPLTSRLVCVLDFSQVPLASAVNGDSRQVIKAVLEIVWVYAPVLLHAVVFHKLHRAHEYQWNWIGLGDSGSEQYLNWGVRVIITNTTDELDSLLQSSHGGGLHHSLGGHDEDATLRYACDYGRTVCEHLCPSALMLDNFWAHAPELARKRSLFQQQKHSIQERNEEHLATSLPYFCLKTKPLEVNTASLLDDTERRTFVDYTLDTVPCCGGLLQSVDQMHERLCDRYKVPASESEKTTDVNEYIRNAAACDVLGIHPGDLSIPSHPAPCLPPSIQSTANVSREPARICVWKGLGYRELCKPLRSS